MKIYGVRITSEIRLQILVSKRRMFVIYFLIMEELHFIGFSCFVGAKIMCKNTRKQSNMIK